MVAFGGQDYLFFLHPPGAPRVDLAGCGGSCQPFTGQMVGSVGQLWQPDSEW